MSSAGKVILSVETIYSISLRLDRVRDNHDNFDLRGQR